jgi:AraC-like DNA-binding protein
VQLNHRWNYKNVISPYYRLYYINEGEGLLSNASQQICLEPGYIYLIPSFTLCNLYCKEYLSQYFIQFFEDSPDGISLFHHNRSLMKLPATELDIVHFQRMLAINPGRGINRSDNPKVYEKSDYYREYQALNNRQSMGAYLETQGIILQLLSRFVDSENFDQAGSEEIPQKVLSAMSYIQINLHQPITVAQLASRASQHPDYFSRQFLRYTGERPLAYIHTKRIERAQFLIITTRMAYSEIASEIGFDSLPHFSRVFKKITRLTPGEYRRQYQQMHDGE